MKLLIGITGKARSGKDTLADILHSHHEFTRTSLAGPLKEAATIAFAELRENLATQEGKAEVSPYWGVTRRSILQDFGEAMCQTFGLDFWVKRWFLNYSMLKDTDDIVVSDVRKDLEAAAIRAVGGIIVHLQRDGAGLTGTEATHVTEQGVTRVSGDIAISNNGSLADLRGSADKLVAYAQKLKHG